MIEVGRLPQGSRELKRDVVGLREAILKSAPAREPRVETARMLLNEALSVLSAPAREP